MEVFYGDSVAFAQTFPFNLISYDGNALITVDKNNQGDILLTGDILDSSYKLIARITQNNFVVATNNISYQQRPDASTLIVYDSYGNEVLSFRYLNNHAIQLLGNFYYQPDLEFLIQSTTQTLTRGKLTMLYSGSCLGTPLQMTSSSFSM
jgi:hypothetical protein